MGHRRSAWRTRILAGAALGSFAAAQAAQAQAPAAASEPREQGVLTAEVVVTAQRRAESLQSVPLSVSAVSGEQMQELNIQDAQRIVDFIPNFKAAGLGGASGPPFFNIRGISFVDFSNINEASVALYVDDVYQVAQGAGTQQVFDLERVEVLRGPQGTLFGRNSTAGLVHYVTRKPTADFSGELSAQYGRFDQVILQAAAGGPITDGVRARAAVKYNRDDGWQRNTVSGDGFAKTDAIAARLILQADLTQDVMLEGKLSYAYNDGQSPIHRPYFVLDPSNPSGYCGGRPVPGTPADLAHAACILASRGVSRTAGRAFNDFSPTRGTSDVDDWPFEYKSRGAYGKLTADLGFADLVAITGFEDYRQTFRYDGDGFDNRPYGGVGSRDLGVNFWSHARTLSQEVRLSGESEGGLKWLGGVYYYDGEQHAQSGTSVDTVIADLIGYATRTESLAGFAQVDVPVGEKVTVSGGLRYTHDKREMDPLDCTLSNTSRTCAATPVDRISEDELTYRAAVEFRPVDGILTYASISHGFKSGGWNPNRNAALRGPVGSEKVDNYELGLKSRLLDGRVTFNAAAFYYKYQGIQTLIGTTDPITGATTSLYINAGDPRTYGAEVEFSASVTDALELRIGAGYLDTKVIADPAFTADGRALNGNRLPQAPEFSANAIIRYTVPLGERGDLTLQADGRYQTSVFSGVDNDPAERVPAYGVANGRVRWRSADRRYAVEGFVDNVFDKNVIQQMFHNTLGSFPVTITANSPVFDSGFGVWGRPRTWGVRIERSF